MSVSIVDTRQRVLVTGASGFIGSHLLDFICSGRFEILALSRRGLSAAQSLLNGVINFTGELSDSSTLSRLPVPIHTIIHCAGRVPSENTTPESFIRDNVVATQNLLSLARQCGCRTFIYLSTVSVHGRVFTDYLNECTPVSEPTPYGRSKYLAAELIKESEGQFRALEVRLPGVVGRGSTTNWLTQCFRNGVVGLPIRVFNPFSLFNNVVHVGDLAAFIANVVSSVSWSGRHIVCLGSSAPMETIEVASRIARGTGGKSRVVIETASRRAYLIDYTKAQNIFGYSPRSVDQVLADFLQENIK